MNSTRRTGQQNPRGTLFVGPMDPQITPYLVTPFTLTCVDGRSRRAAVALAVRDHAVLLAMPEEGRFGVGTLDAAHEGEALELHQFADLAKAVTTFFRFHAWMYQ